MNAAEFEQCLWLSKTGQSINLWFTVPNSSLLATIFSPNVEVWVKSIRASSSSELREMWGGAGPGTPQATPQQ